MLQVHAYLQAFCWMDLRTLDYIGSPLSTLIHNTRYQYRTNNRSSDMPIVSERNCRGICHGKGNVLRYSCKIPREDAVTSRSLIYSAVPLRLVLRGVNNENTSTPSDHPLTTRKHRHVAYSRIEGRCGVLPRRSSIRKHLFDFVIVVKDGSFRQPVELRPSLTTHSPLPQVSQVNTYYSHLLWMLRPMKATIG